MNKLVENHHVVQALWSAVNTSSGSLENVAPLIKKLLTTEAWRRREVPQLGRIVEFDDFVRFIKTDPLEGCGWPPEKVEALLKDEPEVLQRWREAITGKPHVHKADSYNITIKPKRGTDRAYTLDRLKRERPDLFAKVCAGNLSANAAAIEAGFRKKPSPFEQIKKLIPKLTDAQRQELRAMLE